MNGLKWFNERVAQLKAFILAPSHFLLYFCSGHVNVFVNQILQTFSFSPHLIIEIICGLEISYH